MKHVRCYPTISLSAIRRNWTNWAVLTLAPNFSGTHMRRLPQWCDLPQFTSNSNSTCTLDVFQFAAAYTVSLAVMALDFMAILRQIAGC